MSDLIERYRKGEDTIPESNSAWMVYGAGIENLGCNGKPEAVAVPTPGPGELLTRVDANGLCFSDIKIIKQGENHPRIRGRDLKHDPIILGHETALTVVKVGEGLEDRFHVGDRFIVQADIFYKGAGIAFGYLLPGGLEQYTLIGKEILEGDEGCYLLPVKSATGYAEAALTEPWACVEASYRIFPRQNIKQGGNVLVYRSNGEPLGNYAYEGLNKPARVVVNDDGDPTARPLREAFLSSGGMWASIDARTDLPAVVKDHTDGKGFDDVVILGTPEPEVFEALAAAAAKNGVVAVFSDKPLARPVAIDVGRVHYENIVYLGSTGKDILSAYRGIRGSDLTPGGKIWLVGTGGPMGQMHLQRAVEIPSGPKVIVATDLDLTRLETLKDRFLRTADERGTDLYLYNPNAMQPGEFDQKVNELTAGKGFDEIAVMVPVPAVIADASKYLGQGGGMNIFAGVGIGTMATLDLSGVWLKGQRYWGSSGSTIADLRVMLEKTETRQVVTNNSVAAIAGLNAASEGLVGLMEARFPGKTVIFPQFPNLPLTALTDLHKTMPNVAAKLRDGKFWCKEAEDELLRSCLAEVKKGSADAA